MGKDHILEDVRNRRQQDLGWNREAGKRGETDANTPAPSELTSTCIAFPPKCTFTLPASNTAHRLHRLNLPCHPHPPWTWSSSPTCDNAAERQSEWHKNQGETQFHTGPLWAHVCACRDEHECQAGMLLPWCEVEESMPRLRERKAEAASEVGGLRAPRTGMK